MGWGETLLRVALPLLVVGLLTAASFRAAARKPARCIADGPEDEPYRVYTREFDLEVTAAEAIAGLQKASPDWWKGWISLTDASWNLLSTQTEALLAKLRDMPVEHGPGDRDWRLRAMIGQVPADDIVVALLIDQSGSMKGEPIIWSAVSAALISTTLDQIGIRNEVLGFSTAGWRGGHAHSRWQSDGSPSRPGRLCALRHVIYKSADEPRLSQQALRSIVHPDLLRENIDGEALQWASDRLTRRPERHKLLIVISDAPRSTT